MWGGEGNVTADSCSSSVRPWRRLTRTPRSRRQTQLVRPHHTRGAHIGRRASHERIIPIEHIALASLTAESATLLAAMEFAPSRESTDEAGKRWRCCAGAAIVNAAGELLVGERIKIAGAWNCPQGGIDATSAKHGGPESALEAAAREAFEEVGLEVGVHIVPLAVMADDAAVRYVCSEESNSPFGVHRPVPMLASRVPQEAGGWLKKEGFAGQQLHWALFGVMDPLVEADVCGMCHLGGHGGEAAEFSQVKWASLESVVRDMWPGKRGPYEALASWARPILESRRAAIGRVSLSGRWVRDNCRHVALVEALIARGMAAEAAKAEAAKPYAQQWEAAVDAGTALGTYQVTTYADDGVSVRRSLRYDLGDWEEEFCAAGALYSTGGDGSTEGGSSTQGKLQRRTAYIHFDGGGDDDDRVDAAAGVAAGGACGGVMGGVQRAATSPPRASSATPRAPALFSPTRVAHVTWTTRAGEAAGGGGREVSMRFRVGGEMRLRRIYWVMGQVKAAVVSEEVFVREEGGAR